MKNLCILTFFICVWATSLLHANQYPWAHLPSNQQADSLKSVIVQLGINDLDSIIIVATQLRQIAEKLHDDSCKAYAIKEMAWAYRHKQHLAESIQHYFQTITLYQQLADSAGLGTAYYNIGLIFAKAKQHDKALNYLKQAKDYYHAAGEDDKVILALYDMAKRYIEKGDPKAAASLLNEALGILPHGKDLDKSTKAMIYNRLGWTAKDQQDYAGARSYYQKSLSELDNSPKWGRKKAIAYNNIAESYFLEGKYDSARIYIKKALNKKEQLNDSDFTLSTYVLLGKLEFNLGNKRKALGVLNYGIDKVKTTNKLSKNMNEALAMVTTIINASRGSVLLEGTTLTRYFEIQQQQFQALQYLKYHLDKYSIQAGENLFVREKDTKVLQASLTDKENTLTIRKLIIAGLIIILAALLALGLPFIKKLNQRNQKTLQDKETFIKDLISEYDHKIIQLMIVKAEYEEILGKRKRGMGLDEDDLLD